MYDLPPLPLASPQPPKNGARNAPSGHLGEETMECVPSPSAFGIPPNARHLGGYTSGHSGNGSTKNTSGMVLEPNVFVTNRPRGFSPPGEPGIAGSGTLPFSDNPRRGNKALHILQGC